MKNARILSVLFALVLQAAPLARMVMTAQMPGDSPFRLVMQVVVGALALAGSYHAVSGASDTIITSPTTATATVGKAFSYRITLSGTHASSSPIYFQTTVNGTPAAGQSQNVPAPGLTAGGTSSFITGVPTVPGTYFNTTWASSKSGFSSEYTRSTLTLTVLPVSPPSITNAPSNQAVAPGTPVTFTVGVRDTNGPVTYRWYFDGSPVFGGTNASLALESAQITNAGTYKVVATGVGGAVSAQATLTVTGPPGLIVPPHDTYATPGSAAILTVTAGGSGPLQYQWRLNGADLPGKTAATLALANVQPTNGGRYSVVVSNSQGVVVSPDAFLRISYGGVASAAPVFGLNKVWRYDASARDLGVAWREFDYNDSAWLSGPGALAVETNPTFLGLVGSIGTALPLNTLGGTYITNFYFRTHFTLANTSQVTSLVFSNLVDDGAIVYLNGQEAFRTTNMPAGNVPAGSFTLGSAVEATNYLVFSVAPTNLVAGDNVLAVEVHQQATGSSDVVFAMALNTSLSAPNTAPIILTNPAPQTVNAGSPVTFQVSAEGTSSLHYRWFKDGVPVPNGTSATLSIPSAQAADVGTYTVVVSNAFASVTSAAAVLAVTQVGPPPAPSLVVPPAPAGNLNFSFQTSPSFSYTVEYSDTLATNSWLVLTNIPAGGSVQTINIAEPTTSGMRYYRTRLNY